jgi:cob(I)alamin adenosyltransferase
MDAEGMVAKPMTVYTRAGDKGETGLMSGERVRKDHPRVEAMGAVDELNSALGLALALLEGGPAREALGMVQNDLFSLGADLALPAGRRAAKAFSRITADRVQRLEATIDAVEARLGPQRQFVLPGGTPGAAAIHLARSIARRAERRLVSLAGSEEVNPEAIRYLNRLSSLLHVLALEVNREAGIGEQHPQYS